MTDAGEYEHLRERIASALDDDHREHGFTLGRVEHGEHRRMADLVLDAINLTESRDWWADVCWLWFAGMVAALFTVWLGEIVVWTYASFTAIGLLVVLFRRLSGSQGGDR